MNPAQNSGKSLSPLRVMIAVIIGLLGAEAVWTIQPYNNFILNNSFIADNYIPELVVGIIMLLVLAVNPLIRLLNAVYALNVRQLALIFGIMLVATSLSQTHRIYPHSLARGNMDACKNIELSRIHEEMELPESLYLDKVEYGKRAPVSEQFYYQLDPENAIPWAAWRGPLFSWGAMIIAVWIMMVGLGMVVFPQWRENERLPFPLLAVQQELIEQPEIGKKLPPIFYNKVFWAGCLLVIVIHAFNGLSHHTGGLFPSIPTSWGLWGAFSDGLWRYMNWYAKTGRILFVIVGISYFMPNRIGFSLWFTFVAYQVYRVIGIAYFAPFDGSTVSEHRVGAAVAISIIVIWLGRNHWKKVFWSMFRRAESEDARRNRISGWMFFLGCSMLYVWLLWTGTNPVWALAFVLLAALGALVLMRIVCETGLPFLALQNFGPRFFMTMMPAKMLNFTTYYIGGFLDMILTGGGSRTSAAVLSIHALGMDKEAKPRQQIRLGYLFIFVLALGILLCGITHVAMTYRHAGTVDGLRNPVASWGSGRVNIVHNDLKSLQRGSWGQTSYSRPKHFVFGFIIGGALQIACLLSPSWPLHPVGMMLAGSWYLGMAWFSIFVGWAVKMLIVTYGGARAYRVARPLFLGLIIGEVFSAIIWAAVPVILIYLGGDAAEIGRIVIIPQ